MKPDPFKTTLMQLFGEASRVMYELRKDIRPEGVTQVQYNILEYMFFYHGGAAVGSIAECLYMPISNTSREIKKMVEAGYLDKIQDKKDRRSYMVVLTDKGQTMMTESFATVFDRADVRFKDLSEVDRVKLTEEMGHIIERVLF